VWIVLLATASLVYNKPKHNGPGPSGAVAIVEPTH
jgi:hypothetical protein